MLKGFPEELLFFGIDTNDKMLDTDEFTSERWHGGLSHLLFVQFD